MSVSLTELRQRLFTLADQVIDTGIPVIIERRGVRLRLVREEAAPAAMGRLQKLKAQTLVSGKPLDPGESPAQWSEFPLSNVAEQPADYPKASPRRPRGSKAG